MIISVVLVPESKFGELLEETSSEFAKSMPSTYVVGKNSIAHCSLLQFDSSVVVDTKKKLAKMLGSRVRLKTTETYRDVSEHGNTWFGVGIELSKALLAVQERFIAKTGLPRSAFHKGIGTDYKPHFTLGMIPQVLPLAEPFGKNLEGKTVTCTLRLGVCGEHYALKEIL